jgi:PAP2 superfamily C-terminal
MESLTGAEPQVALRAARVLLIAAGLAGWFWTQRILAARAFPAGRISDRIHEWTAPWNRYLREHPAAADRLLVASSAVIDALGLFLLGSAVFGATVRPFLGLLLLFALRQICQALTALPAPEGMIWRDPGFPSLLVTYGTATDLFFSGHTAIAVYGCVELARQGGPVLAVLGVAIAVFEAATVLVVRAHYTMDVFTAVVVALWAAGVAAAAAPAADRLLAALVGG